MTEAERQGAVMKAERLIAQGEPDDAMRVCNDVLNEHPDYVPALFTVGRVLMRVERFGLAYAINRRCLELMPEEAGTWNNAGMCAASIPGMLDEAERLLRRSLKLNDTNKAALNNMALVCVHRCDPKAAIAYCERSLAMDQDQPEVWESWGYAHLMQGDFANGWDGYEKIVGHSKYRKDVAYHSEPRWTGEAGGRLVIRGEQGIGDEISAASCLPDAMAENVVTFECDRRLEGLFKRSFPTLEIHGTRFDKGATWTTGRKWDWHTLLNSLPSKYRREAKAFPGTPFLIADPDRRAQWRVLLDRLPGLKVGIAWTGGLKNTFKDRRSVSLDTLTPILSVPGCSFVSLQYKDPTAEIAELQERRGLSVTHWARAAEARDYDEVAALVAELDLVITVTTAAVDCAGALGKECWVLAPSKPHWRFLLVGKRMPWYSSVEIFRQEGRDWGSVVKRIAGELRGRVDAVGLHWNGHAAASGVYGAANLDTGASFRAVRRHGADSGAIAGQAPGAD